MKFERCWKTESENSHIKVCNNLEVKSVVAPAKSLSLDELVTNFAFVTVQQIMTVYTQGLIVPENVLL